MSEGNYSIDNIPTFVALPVDAFQTNPQKPEQFRIIKNAIIKTLSDGSLCIIDANEFSETVPQQQIEVTYLPTPNTIQIENTLPEKPQIISHDVSNNQIPPQKPSSPLYKCPKCKDVFDKIASYRKHMMWHRNVKKFKCDKCAAGYNVETNLKIHMAMHAEGKPTCPICSISFQRLASLKSHLMLHQVEELYTCEECGAEFEKEEELNKHSQNHLNNTIQENSSLVCSYCNVQFEDRKSYKEHITHHIKVKKMVLSGKKSRKTNGSKNHPHTCSVCLKSFSKHSLLERHLRVHSGERPFICEHCNKGFNQKGTLQIHLSKHTGIKPFQCTLCSAKFNQKGNLRVHVEKTHTAPLPGVKMYKCPHCTCIFKRIASLNVHITKCHATNEELADIASVMNQLKELEKHTVVTPDMKQHEKEVTEQNKKLLNEMKKSGDVTVTHTSYVRLAESFLDGTVRRYLVMQKKVNDLKWYICSYCSKEFKKPSDLIRHTRVHTREKPFTCKQCGASFALKSTLFYHVKTHISNNNYFCAICMKKFSSLRSVNMHLRKHADKPHYKCLSCNKWFTTVQKAKLHDKEVHNNNQASVDRVELKQPLLSTPNGLLPITSQKTVETSKQYPCPLCSAKFTKMTNLRRHMLIHNGERKFKCEMCLKSYFTAHALKEHMLYHSGVRNYACKVCGKKFMTSSLLKRHLISHNTSKPYVCPYCNKNFKSVVLCKKHMNVHRKEINLQINALNETGELKNFTDAEKNKLLGISPRLNIPNDNVAMTQDTQISSGIEIMDNNFQLLRQESDRCNLTTEVINSSTTVVQNPIEQQLYEVTPNSIQIITNSDKNLTQNSNQIQTIFIKCEDLQLTENLYSQNADTMLFNSLTDLQDNNTFSIDPIGSNFTTQNIEVYNADNISNEQAQTINITDLNTKVVKLNNINIGSNKAKGESNINLTDALPSDYSQPELNLLFNLDSEFEANHCGLPADNLTLPDINLNEVPVLNVEPQQETVEVVNANDRKEKRPFTCSKCSKVFTNKKTFMKHLQTHRETKKGVSSHQCSFCDKTFKKHSDLVRHIRTHTGEKPFACDKCEKRFSLKSTLLSHQRTHNPVIPKQFSCIVCNSFFSSKSSLKVHMSVHTGDKTHKCNFCPMKFRTAAHRKSHENSYHINPPKKKAKNKVTSLLASVAMDVLNQDQNNLQNEQVIATSDLENVLVVQEQMPFTGDQLNLLSETNPSTLPEATQLEPLIFQQLQSNILLQDNLISSPLIQLDDGTFFNVKTIEPEEQTIHNVDPVIVEKPRNLECDICHKKYASKDVLRKHKKIHGIDKKFRCTKCEKGFDTEASLEIHEKTHDGYRPYSCLYCVNSFAKEHSLTTHMKRIHNISSKDFLLYDLK